MLTNCNDKDYALSLIRQNIDLFTSFDKVFIFGSILQPEKTHHDIDILLIYSVYSEQLVEIVNNIHNVLNKVSTLPVDLTVLSVVEEKEFKFLQKQNLNYLQIK